MTSGMAERKEPVPAKYDVNAKWDACLDLTIRRLVYTSAAGAFGGLLLFRSPVTRWASVAFGAGLGVGSAYIDCKHIFGGSPAKLETPTSASDAKSTPPTTFSDTHVDLAPSTAVPDTPASQLMLMTHEQELIGMQAFCQSL